MIPFFASNETVQDCNSSSVGVPDEALVAPQPKASRLPTQPCPSSSKHQSRLGYCVNSVQEGWSNQTRHFGRAAQWNGVGPGFAQRDENWSRGRGLGWRGSYSRSNRLCRFRRRERGMGAQGFSSSTTSSYVRNFATGTSQGNTSAAGQQGSTSFQLRNAFLALSIDALCHGCGSSDQNLAVCPQ